jgi:heat shock protein HslJ
LRKYLSAAGHPPEVMITAYFSADGSLTGSGGCNNYTTSYIANGDVMTIYPAGSGKSSCGEPADSLELAYLELLPQVANFQIADGLLIMLNNGGAEILRFLPN